ncbi:MAG TPA: 4a-hydroxytetrahydrobiopterin dehydratase [Acidimicrobiia bacterium]|nr:4a-hydroxytetrahydrobiopterin dehydratase [Acidimicrobiia bacterium]
MATMSDTEIKAALADIPGWELAGSDIVREYKFADFVAAIAFVNQLADKAEAANHHPDIDIRWNKVRLALSTHSEGGLTQKDFALAAELESLAGTR